MFDVVVVGGGMVGSAAALGLADLGLKVAVIESHMPKAFVPDAQPDMRVSAISAGSIKLLDSLGAWQYVEAMRTCPVRQLSTWEMPTCRTNFYASDIKSDYLCHIVENNLVQLGLHQAIKAAQLRGSVDWFNDSSMAELSLGETPCVLLEDGRKLACRLIIGADGAQSKVRACAGIGTEGWQYAQQALGIKVNTHCAQQDITWQQFSPSGPMAFLPLFGGYASLVWYHHSERIKQLKAMPFAQLKQQIQAAFPTELVDFEILQVASFPLTRQHAQQYVKPGLLLAGDAAHTINPLAGQGVNLGFKDVKALLELVAAAFENEQSWHQVSYLQQYARSRSQDNLLMMSAMDCFYAAFSNGIAPLKLLRNLGLTLADHAGLAKNKAMAYAMGID